MEYQDKFSTLMTFLYEILTNLTALLCNPIFSRQHVIDKWKNFEDWEFHNVIDKWEKNLEDWEFHNVIDKLKNR